MGTIFGLIAGVFYAGYMLSCSAVATLAGPARVLAGLRERHVLLLVVALVRGDPFTGYSMQTWAAFLGMGLISQVLWPAARQLFAGRSARLDRFAHTARSAGAHGGAGDSALGRDPDDVARVRRCCSYWSASIWSIAAGCIDRSQCSPRTDQDRSQPDRIEQRGGPGQPWPTSLVPNDVGSRNDTSIVRAAITQSSSACCLLSDHSSCDSACTSCRCRTSRDRCAQISGRSCARSPALRRWPPPSIAAVGADVFRNRRSQLRLLHLNGVNWT